MLFLYNISIWIYCLVVQVASLWNAKAKAWTTGRKDWSKKLQRQVSSKKDYVWVHCSSAGEFEQGKPIIQRLKRDFPKNKIIVTFFSPSGMNVARNYAFADIITFLPVDTVSNAKEFLQMVKPKLAIFIKYDFWFHFLHEAKRQQIPLLLVSAVFRKNQLFFKSYASFYRKMLHLFQDIFVQDETSLQLLKEYNLENCSVVGDTRFDRVSGIASEWTPIPMIDSFIGNESVLVAGSTWAGDETVLEGCSVAKMIIAPHELDESHLRHIENLFPQSIRYSKLMADAENKQVLIIDNVGMLSRLYKYATVAYVGGGFTKDGIHNVLEAAVYGKPVIFGPNFAKYREANELIAAGGAFSVANKQALQSKMTDLLHNKVALEKAAAAAKIYVEKNTGATAKIMAAIQEKRLLTN